MIIVKKVKSERDRARTRALRVALELLMLCVLVYAKADAKGRQQFLLGAPGVIPAAVSVTAISGPSTGAAPSNDVQEWTVIATADSDTVTATIPHVMGANAQPTITNILQAPAGLSLWAITTLSATGFILTKSTATGSGNAAAQIRIRIARLR